MSAETIEFHYGKHHRGYVDQLNRLVQGTAYESLTLEALVLRAPAGPMYDHAAQAWNHEFFWNCLAPGGHEPREELLMALERTFGGLDEFRAEWLAAAEKHFGSGYVWLAAEESGNLHILTTANAENPMNRGLTPLLTCDLWEHAYYLDYRNERMKFAEKVFRILNWGFAGSNFLQAHGDRVQISA